MDEARQLADLRRLLAESSKHSGYQVLPRQLEERLGELDVPIKSRHERERLRFLQAHLSFRDAAVLDIGGNTGFFSFEALAAGAASVDLHEGNPAHARFVERAAALLGMSDRLRVAPGYFDFADPPVTRTYDVGILLNVLHHVGDDFGDASISVDAARDAIGDSLRRMSRVVRTLAFQLGFCWKGDRTLPLFREGTKAEQLEFLRERTAEDWETIAVGVAEVDGGEVVYREPTAENMRRRDDLGEFLNRPLLVLRSRHR